MLITCIWHTEQVGVCNPGVTYRKVN